MIDSKRLTAWYDFQAPAYHFWRDNYDGPLVQRVSQLLSDSDGHAPLRVLDVGCGSGLFTLGLAKRHPTWALEGLDPSTGLLKIANKQAQKRNLSNVRFLAGDAMALPHGDGEFDVAVSAGMFPNINDHAAALAQIHRVLKPGGQLIVVEFDRTTMTRTTRLFFKGMIAAYKIISLVFRRFRFADRWNVESSTIDGQRFSHNLDQAGFEPSALLREHSHMIFHCAKRVP